MTERTCPLMNGAICRKEKCQWYNIAGGCCVIWDISYALSEMQDDG